MHTQIGKDIQKAKELLQKGHLVAIPTETVYGLAGNALNKKAIVSIFEAKNRPYFDPLIVHIDGLEKAKQYVKELPEKAILLAQKLWPGPITLLLPKSDIIPDLVTSGLPLIALRTPSQVLTNELLKELDFPLAAPSANPFGYISPTTAQHVFDQLNGKIPYILDGGPCQIGLESTIVSFEEEVPTIRRLGGVSVEAIEQIIGKVKINKLSTDNPKAPGELTSHYAPKKPFIVGDLDLLLEKYVQQDPLILTLNKYFSNIPAKKQFMLSETGNLSEAAQNLFSTLRKLDQAEGNLIIGEFVPEIGLGRAINDRLRRASADKK